MKRHAQIDLRSRTPTWDGGQKRMVGPLKGKETGPLKGAGHLREELGKGAPYGLPEMQANPQVA